MIGQMWQCPLVSGIKEAAWTRNVAKCINLKVITQQDVGITCHNVKNKNLAEFNFDPSNGGLIC